MPVTTHPGSPNAQVNSPRRHNFNSHEDASGGVDPEAAAESLSESDYEDSRSPSAGQSDDSDDVTKVVDNTEDSDDDLIVETAPEPTTTSDVLSKLGPTYRARLNGVLCSLSSGHGFAAFEEEVLAVAPAGKKEDLMIWYKCTFTRQDLLIQQSSFNKYLYKLINGWVATADGSVDLAVLTQRESFRSPGSPPSTPKCRCVSPAPVKNDPSTAEAAGVAEDPFKWRPTGAKIVGGHGTEDSPFVIGSVDVICTRVRVSPKPQRTMTRARSSTPPRPKTAVAARSLSWSPTGLGKRRRSSPRFSHSQRQQIADHVLGSCEAPIEL